MAGERDDRNSDDVVSPLSSRAWAVIVFALLTGSGSGIAAFTSSSAVSTEQAAATQALLQIQIDGLRRDLERLEGTVGRIDETHPPPDLIKKLDDHEVRIRELSERAR